LRMQEIEGKNHYANNRIGSFYHDRNQLLT